MLLVKSDEAVWRQPNNNLVDFRGCFCVFENRVIEFEGCTLAENPDKQRYLRGNYWFCFKTAIYARHSL